MDQPTKRLTRSRTNRILGGVCGGVAEYFGIDATILRIAVVLLALWKGWMVTVYVVAWIVMPDADAAPSGDDRVKQVTNDVKHAAERVAGTLRADSTRQTTRYIVGGIIVLFGAVALIRPYVSWDLLRWDFFWPLVLIAVGALILTRRV